MMASCGSFPDVPEDTAPVVSEPPAEPAPAPSPPMELLKPLSPPTVSAPQGPLVGDEAGIGFVAGSRFVVFARATGAAFVVFDRDRGETFRVSGKPIGQRTELAGGATRWSLEGDGEGHVLVRSEGGVQLVDLSDRGRMIAGWRGVPSSASLAPDGRTFAVATASAVHVVRASDGAIGTFASALGDSGVVPTWGASHVFWIAGDTLVRVDRERLTASVIRGGEMSTFAMSSDAAVVAVAAEGAVTVFTDGRTTPALRIATPDVSQLLVQSDGANVVWVERRIDEQSFTDEGHIHSIDVAAKAHARFEMVNSGCANAPETVQAVRDGEIVSDPSCALGCPSVRWTHRSVTYDAHTGKVIEDTSTTEAKSWNEEQDELREEIVAAAKALGVELGAMIHDPNHDAVLLERSSGLTLVKKLRSERKTIDLEASSGAAVAQLTLSADGAVIAGIVGDRARAWEAATGRALLR